MTIKPFWQIASSKLEQEIEADWTWLEQELVPLFDRLELPVAALLTIKYFQVIAEGKIFPEWIPLSFPETPSRDEKSTEYHQLLSWIGNEDDWKLTLVDDAQVYIHKRSIPVETVPEETSKKKGPKTRNLLKGIIVLENTTVQEVSQRVNLDREAQWKKWDDTIDQIEVISKLEGNQEVIYQRHKYKPPIGMREMICKWTCESSSPERYFIHFASVKQSDLPNDEKIASAFQEKKGVLRVETCGGMLIETIPIRKKSESKVSGTQMSLLEETPESEGKFVKVTFMIEMMEEGWVPSIAWEFIGNQQCIGILRGIENELRKEDKEEEREGEEESREEVEDGVKSDEKESEADASEDELDSSTKEILQNPSDGDTFEDESDKDTLDLEEEEIEKKGSNLWNGFKSLLGEKEKSRKDSMDEIENMEIDGKETYEKKPVPPSEGSGVWKGLRRLIEKKESPELTWAGRSPPESDSEEDHRESRSPSQ